MNCLRNSRVLIAEHLLELEQWRAVQNYGKQCRIMSKYCIVKNSWQVATAAEAFAAAQIARCEWDISVQYGANQPEYDLVAVDGDRALKISVKGSKDGGWGLTQSFLSNANYHLAADTWILKHSKKTIFCLVQFKNVAVYELPRMYLATPEEIGNWLKSAAAGRGDTILYEEHIWTSRAKAAGHVDRIPEIWKFTPQRLADLGTSRAL
jgi:hypothetical protein